MFQTFKNKGTPVQLFKQSRGVAAFIPSTEWNIRRVAHYCFHLDNPSAWSGIVRNRSALPDNYISEIARTGPAVAEIVRNIADTYVHNACRNTQTSCDPSAPSSSPSSSHPHLHTRIPYPHPRIILISLAPGPLPPPPLGKVPLGLGPLDPWTPWPLALALLPLGLGPLDPLDPLGPGPLAPFPWARCPWALGLGPLDPCPLAPFRALWPWAPGPLGPWPLPFCPWALGPW